MYNIRPSYTEWLSPQTSETYVQTTQQSNMSMKRDLEQCQFEVDVEKSTKKIRTDHVQNLVDNNIPEQLDQSTKNIRIKMPPGQGTEEVLSYQSNTFDLGSFLESNKHISIKCVYMHIPKQTAMMVATEETVTTDNIHQLQSMVNNGRENYPGAIFYRDANNIDKLIDLDGKICPQIKLGDIVGRHQLDGDEIHSPSLQINYPVLIKVT